MTYQGMAGTPTSAPESESATESGLQPGEVVLGHFVGLSAEGKPLVEFNENPQPDALIAVSTVNLTRQQIGRQVALLFAEGDLSKPVILGLLHSPLYSLLDSFAAEEPQATQAPPADSASAENAQPTAALVDGEAVLIEGKKEIVLRCGEASITLTRAGKIIIRGKYLLSRSSGVNRILGGSVQVN